MRKIYSLLLMTVMMIGLGFSASAAVTVKVNKTGIASFEGMGVITSLDNEVTMLEPNQGVMLIGEIKVPSDYSMTIKNETTGKNVDVAEYGGELRASINPTNVSDGDVLDVTIGEGGAVIDPQDQKLTVVFQDPASGYVVTLKSEDGPDGSVKVDDETFKPDADGVIELVYSSMGEFEVRPNEGYALLNMKEEGSSNPHDNGFSPNLDGNIYCAMSQATANSTLIVTSTKAGSFKVKGVGEKIANIDLQNLTTYSSIPVTSEFQSVSFPGGQQYKISSSNYSSPLWKVEVTNDGYTEEIENNYGSFFYIPKDGDEVVIYSDAPITYAYIKFSFEGEDVTKSIIKEVMYDYQPVSNEIWESDNWKVEAGKYLNVNFDTTGFAKIKYSVNGGAEQTVTSSYGYCTASINILNDDPENAKDYNIVFTAEKEKFYTVTLECEHPEAVRLAQIEGYYEGAPIEFTKSGDKIQVSNVKNQIKISANNGWSLDGVLIDGREAEYSEFYYGTLTINGDCTVTLNVSDLNAKRNKTAVVYVQDDTNWVYLSFRYADNTEATIEKGYNFVKFCDDDLPLSFGSYGPAGESIFYVNGELASNSYACPETMELEDGAVIKYFAGTPTSYNVTYEVEPSVADAVEIYHDHLIKVDHNATTEFACFGGTQIHIKPAAARSAASTFLVKVGSNTIVPDEDGVYSVVVDDHKAIKVVTAGTSGVEMMPGDGEVFDIFNLQGVAVKRNATTDDLKALPAGIYIAGGKKVVVK